MRGISMLWKYLTSRGGDGLLAALLLIGGFAFADSTTWLHPEADDAPKVLLAQQPTKPVGPTTAPALKYLPVGQGQIGAATSPLPLTKLVQTPSGQQQTSVGGGTGASDATPIHFTVKHQGIALGNGATIPSGGFGVPSPARSAAAVPEPSEWVLITLGLGMVAAFARRKPRVAPRP